MIRQEVSHHTVMLHAGNNHPRGCASYTQGSEIMDKQVVIYLDDPDGQLIQTSYSEYKSYWKHIGWRILDRAPELPGMETERIQKVMF